LFDASPRGDASIAKHFLDPFFHAGIMTGMPQKVAAGFKNASWHLGADRGTNFPRCS
jgi:hypothetical protein